MPSLHRHSSDAIRLACWTCTPRDKSGRALTAAELTERARAVSLPPPSPPREPPADVAALLASCPDCRGSGMLHVEYRNGATEDRPCRRCEWARRAAGR
jgi:hypothetical protein